MKNYKKDFMFIFSGQLFSLLTSQVVQYTIIWYLTFKTNSAIVLAFATIAGVLPQIILGPFAGVLVDRLNRKNVMIVSDIFTAVITVIFSVSFLFGEPSVIYIYLILFLRALGTTFHSPSLQASIPLMVPKEKRRIVRVAEHQVNKKFAWCFVYIKIDIE